MGRADPFPYDPAYREFADAERNATRARVDEAFAAAGYLEVDQQFDRADQQYEIILAPLELDGDDHAVGLFWSAMVRRVEARDDYRSWWGGAHQSFLYGDGERIMEWRLRACDAFERAGEFHRAAVLADWFEDPSRAASLWERAGEKGRSAARLRPKPTDAEKASAALDRLPSEAALSGKAWWAHSLHVMWALADWLQAVGMLDATVSAEVDFEVGDSPPDEVGLMAARLERVAGRSERDLRDATSERPMPLDVAVTTWRSALRRNAIGLWCVAGDQARAEHVARAEAAARSGDPDAVRAWWSSLRGFLFVDVMDLVVTELVNDAAARNDYRRAAVLLDLNDLPRRAAAFYEQAGDLRRAASRYEEAGAFGEAIRCLQMIGEVERAEVLRQYLPPPAPRQPDLEDEDEPWDDDFAGDDFLASISRLDQLVDTTQVLRNGDMAEPWFVTAITDAATLVNLHENEAAARSLESAAARVEDSPELERRRLNGWTSTDEANLRCQVLGAAIEQWLEADNIGEATRVAISQARALGEDLEARREWWDRVTLVCGAVVPPWLNLAIAEDLAACKEWQRAAVRFHMLGDADRAAQMYERAGDLRRAAVQFEESGQFGDAARCWREAGDTERAAAATLFLEAES